MKTKCIVCGSPDRDTIDSRDSSMKFAGQRVVCRRRRVRCKNCGDRVTTYELEKWQVERLVEPYKESKQQLDALKEVLAGLAEQ